MNIQMMEGLLGASSNLKLSGTPMSVYRQASAEGDTEKMKQALGYTGECTEKAVQLSEAAKAALKNSRPVEAAEPIESKPVIYTPAGEIIAAPAETEPTVSFTA